MITCEISYAEQDLFILSALSLFITLYIYISKLILAFVAVLYLNTVFLTNSRLLFFFPYSFISLQ